MSYRKVLGEKRKWNLKIPIKSVTVFSDIIGEIEGEGLLHDFKTGQELKELIKLEGSKKTKIQTELIDCAKTYIEETKNNKDWLTAMGLLERKILQYKFYEEPAIAYSTHVRKSGDKEFTYIFLRCPFFDMLKGKFELRVYHNKLEDYPQYSSLDELKEDVSFQVSAKKAVQDEMLKQIEESEITLDLVKELFDDLKNKKSRLK